MDDGNQLAFLAAGSDPIVCRHFVDQVELGSTFGHSGYIPLSVAGPGWHEYYVRAVNQFGSHQTSGWWGGFDNISPSINRIGGIAPQSWVRSGEVVYQVVDPHAGLRVSEWHFEGGPSGSASAVNPRNVPLPSQSGRWTLSARAWDNSLPSPGNEANANLGEFWVDSTNPSVEPPVPSSPSPSNVSSIPVTLSGDDENSGVDRLVLLVDGSPVAERTGNGLVLWNAGSVTEGSHLLTAQAFDAVGNASPISSAVAFVLDRTAPSTTVALSPTVGNGANGWYVTHPTATLTASEPTTSVLYSLGSGWQAYTAPFVIASTGELELSYYSVDIAGNQEPAMNSTVKIDATAPPTPVLTDEGDESGNITSLAIALEGEDDPESHLQYITYMVGDAPGDDRWLSPTTVPYTGNSAIIGGLFIIPGSTVFVTLRTTNYAGLQSGWASTDGVLVDPSLTPVRLDTAVFGSAEDSSGDGEIRLGGTLGESMVGFALPADRSAFLHAGFWGAMTGDVVSIFVDLGGYLGDLTRLPLEVELRLPGKLRPVQQLVGYLASDGTLVFGTFLVGEYDIAIKGSKWLRNKLRAVAISPGGITGLALSLIPGDCDDDNEVSVGDFAILSTSYGSSAGGARWDDRADLDGDGSVDIGDFARLSISYGSVGED